MAIVIHATLAANLVSIRKRGLLTSKTTRRRKAVWFAPETEERWVIQHCLCNRKARLEDVVVLRVNVPDAQLRAHRHGLWYTMVNIPASAIVGIKRFRAYEEVM
jgi:hypothetical protein